MMEYLSVVKSLKYLSAVGYKEYNIRTKYIIQNTKHQMTKYLSVVGGAAALISYAAVAQS